MAQIKAIAYEQLHVSDAIYALQLDGKGGSQLIRQNSQATVEQPCWLHLDYKRSESQLWLEKSPLLPDSIRDSLAGESVRPRVTRCADNVMITLRSVNVDSDRSVVLRLFLTDELIITTRHRRVYGLENVLTDLQNGVGPVNSGDFLIQICDALTDDVSRFIEKLHDKVAELEDNLFVQQVPERGELVLLRKQLIVLRRYMAPQRDAFMRLASEHLPWMTDHQRRLMREIGERLGRGLDELDGSIARTAILADEITTLMADAMNRRIYTMSMLAMLFLPTTFMTGLFGVNLGGIPGNQSHIAFTLFCLLMLVMMAGVIIWLKRNKWL